MKTNKDPGGRWHGARGAKLDDADKSAVVAAAAIILGARDERNRQLLQLQLNVAGGPRRWRAQLGSLPPFTIRTEQLISVDRFVSVLSHRHVRPIAQILDRDHEAWMRLLDLPDQPVWRDLILKMIAHFAGRVGGAA